MLRSARLFQLTTLAALVVSAARAAFVWPKLPPVVASHFGIDGSADAFSSKEQFFTVLGVTTLATLACLLGSVLLMHKIPARYLNLPHRDYWLEESRLPQARQRMASAMWAMTAATMVLFAIILEFVIAANLGQGHLAGAPLWITLGAYLAFTLVWTFRLITSFTPPVDQDG